MSTTRVADWVAGEAGIAYQRCTVCKSIWYFHRDFCPTCGERAPQVLQASGNGVVHAATLITRAPSEELRQFAPYLIALIDTDEGFRMMAHGDKALEIGDRVAARFVSLAGRLMPYFEKTTNE